MLRKKYSIEEIRVDRAADRRAQIAGSYDESNISKYYKLQGMHEKFVLMQKIFSELRMYCAYEVLVLFWIFTVAFHLMLLFKSTPK